MCLKSNVIKMQKLKEYKFRPYTDIDNTPTPFLDWMNELVPNGIITCVHSSVAEIELVLRDPRFTEIKSTNEYVTKAHWMTKWSIKEYAWARRQPDIIPSLSAKLSRSKKSVTSYGFWLDFPMKMINYQNIANHLAFIRNRIIYKNHKRLYIGINNIIVEHSALDEAFYIKYYFTSQLTLFNLVQLYTRYRMHDYIYQFRLSPESISMKRYFETDDESDLPKPSVFLNEILNKRKLI